MRWIWEKLAAQLSGGWVAALMFRSKRDLQAGDLSVHIRCRVPRPRAEARARQELVLLSVFLPVLAANISVPYCGRAFASDASLSKGAYMVAPVSPAVASSLWLAADNKGFYSRLDEPWRAALSAAALSPPPRRPSNPPSPSASRGSSKSGWSFRNQPCNESPSASVTTFFWQGRPL